MGVSKAKRVTESGIEEKAEGDQANPLADRVPTEAAELARRIVEAAADKQASDAMLLDSRGLCSCADYFVICSGESDRQIEAIYEAVVDVLKKEGVVPHHREGDASSGWVLLDLGDIIVHIFAPFEREYYQLEKLWSEAPVLVKIL